MWESKLGRLLIPLVLLVPIATAPIVAGAQAPESRVDGVEARLSLKKMKFAVGEAINITVDVYNRGATDLFVHKEISQAIGTICFVEFRVYDEKENLSPQRTFSAPLLPPPKAAETFSEALMKSWFALPPGYHYGRTITIDDDMVPLLRKPGRYRLVATFFSQGMSTRLYTNPLLAFPEEIQKLPYKDWMGQVDTNSVWIRIIAPAKAR